MIQNGQQLPPIMGGLVGGEDGIDLVDLVRGSWGVVLLYRGHW